MMPPDVDRAVGVDVSQWLDYTA